MKTKLEKKLYKEAKKVNIPNVLDNVYSNIGYDVSSPKHKFWNPVTISLFSSAVAVSCVVAVLIPLALNNETTNNIDNSYSSSYVSLKINPKMKQSNEIESISEVTDSNTATLSLYVNDKQSIEEIDGQDENGKIIQCGLENINTSDLNEILNTIIISAIQTNYIDYTSKDNYISYFISGDNQETKNNLKKKIGQNLINTLSQYCIYGYIVDESVDNSLSDTSYIIDENTESLAKELDIDSSKYKLIEKVLSLYNKDGFEIYSVDTLKSLSIFELGKLIDKASTYESIAKSDKDYDYNKVLDNYYNDKEKNKEKIYSLTTSLDSLQYEIDDLSWDIYSSCKNFKHFSDKDYYNLNYYYRDYFMKQGNKYKLDYPQYLLNLYTPNSPKHSYKYDNNNSLDDKLELLDTKVTESKKLVDDLIEILLDIKNYSNEYYEEPDYKKYYDSKKDDFKEDGFHEHMDDKHWKDDYDDWYYSYYDDDDWD